MGQDLSRDCNVQSDAEPIAGGPGDCGELVGYVDDGAYSYAHASPEILSEVLTRKFKLLEDWVNSNKLVINAEKTHLIVMGPKKVENRRKEVSIKAGQFTIKPTESEKLLGGYLHQSMQWNLHIRDHSKSLVKQITTRINGLKKIAKTATFKTRLMVANGAVMSKLIYMITVWGGAQQYLLNTLQVQQLSAARTVCGFHSQRWSKKKLLDRVGWLSIRQLIKFHTIYQAHKTICSGKPAALYESISTEHPYRTRNATNNRIRGDSSLQVASFRYRAVHWYNQVPPDIFRGSLPTVKQKLWKWTYNTVPID